MTQMEEFVKVNNPDGEGAYKQRMATHGISLVSVGLPSLTASLQGSLYFSNTWQCAIVSVLIQFKLSYLSLS